MYEADARLWTGVLSGSAHGGAPWAKGEAMEFSHRFVRLGVLSVILLACVLAPCLAPTGAVAETAANASGRYDTLVLRDLGGKQAAVIQMIADGGAFSPVELWRSKKGAFDVRKATFVAGDVNGDGIGDGIALVDLGRGRSRLDVFVSDGVRAVQDTAWTSRTGVFARAKAKLAVGDLNRDGRDDVLALYARGRSGAVLYRFISNGKTFKQSVGWSASSGLTWSRAQLAAGDATGDGRDDAIVLYGATAASSRLYVFATADRASTRQTFWSGAYAAGRATLVAGDADSDGTADAICLFRKPDSSGRFDVFHSTKRAFAAPAVWYEQSGGPAVPTTCRLAAGDLTGDGRADVVSAASSGGSAARMTTWVSNGSAFTPRLWYQSAWSYATLSLAVAPSVGLVVSDEAEVLNASSMRYLRRVEADGTLTFAGETGQLSRLEKGDVVLSGASPEFPNGICRKVTEVGGQGGRVVVETAPATLSEVIDQGEIAFGMHVTAADLPDDGIRAPGVRIVRDEPALGALPHARRSDDSDGITFTLTAPIDDIAEAEGKFTLDPDAYCDWDIGWGGLESASYRQVLNTTTDITVSAKKSGTQKAEKTLYKRTLTPITIMVAAVPVVVVPEFEVKIGVEGTLEAGMTAGMTMTTETYAEVSWDGDWHADCGSSYDITPHPPRLSAQLTAEAFAGAGLSFEVYGVAGPTAELKPYVKLVADTAAAADPWWTLSAGLDGEIGLKVEVFDHGVLSKSYSLEIFGPFVIDQAGSETSGGGPSKYRAPSLRGKILDATGGAPVKSAAVEVSQSGSTLRQTSSAADGSYVVFGLSPGAYTVTARKRAYAANSRTATVVADQTTQGQDIQITRSQFQGISGHVFTEAGGTPMFDVDVELYPAGGTAWWQQLDSGVTDAEGYYLIDDVEPGTYRLEAVGDAWHFSESKTVTVAGGQMLENQDFRLVGKAMQGVSGWVVEDLTGHPLDGALVSVRDGDEDGGYAEMDLFTGADGSFVVTELEVGTHWIRVSKPGYEDVLRSFTVRRAEITRLGNVVLKPPAGQSMRSSGDFDWIRWPEGLSSSPYGTCEFWFRPTQLGLMDYANTIAEISRVYPDWNGEGSLAYRPTMRITYMMSGYDVVFAFKINENTGSPTGTWHRVMATTPLELGHWYHVAAVYGGLGMRLFVNGALEGSNDYTGAPQADPGADPSGWFSLGGVEQSVHGDFKGLRVSDVPRYDADFTPPENPAGGSGTLVLDYLAGTTNGYNEGFEPTP